MCDHIDVYGIAVNYGGVEYAHMEHGYRGSGSRSRGKTPSDQCCYYPTEEDFTPEVSSRTVRPISPFSCQSIWFGLMSSPKNVPSFPQPVCSNWVQHCMFTYENFGDNIRPHEMMCVCVFFFFLGGGGGGGDHDVRRPNQ